jgi:hypothetical protein
MLSPQALYPLVLSWITALGAPAQPAATAALAKLVVALLTAQSLRPSAVMRALLSPTPVPARQRYKRRTRALDRPWLTSAWLTPRLVRAVLALLPPEAGLTHLALDSVRCGRWEVFTLGVVWQGRAVPLAWAVLPYPWPKRRVTPTVCGLIQQVAAVWPKQRPVHLLADRAFPSLKLFRALRTAAWGWTVRLRAPMPVEVADGPCTVRDLLARCRVGHWRLWAGQYGQGTKGIAATLVVGRGLTVLPLHQRTEGTQARRAARQAERERVRAYRYASVRQTDPWLALCTTHPTWREAVTSYRQRWALEGSFRDAQSGWDGQHGWDLEDVLRDLPEAGRVAAVVGLWALGYLLQIWIGVQLVRAPAAVRAVAAQWTTTGRLSVWAHGQLALTEPSGCLHAWLLQTLADGAALVAAAPPCPKPQPVLVPPAHGHSPPRKAA